MKRKIVLYSGFNRAKFKQTGYDDNGVHRSLTEPWIKYRSGIWKAFTWQSVLNQTYKDWVYCLCCDNASRNIIDDYFGGIDDERFFLTYSDNQQEYHVMDRLANGNDEIVNVRIDSDDMYHPSAIEELSIALDKYPDNDWFSWPNGYGYQYDETICRMKAYVPKHGSGPFFAKRYTAKEWTEQKYIGIKCQHHKVYQKKPIRLSDNKVLVGIYGGNTTTLFKTKCFKNNITIPEKDKVLREFKII